MHLDSVSNSTETRSSDQHIDRTRQSCEVLTTVELQPGSKRLICLFGLLEGG